MPNLCLSALRLAPLLQPVRFQLALASPAPPAALPPAAGAGGARRSLDAPLAVGMSPGDMPGLTAEPSTDSLGGMLFDSEQATALSKERAAADAAWREHQKVRWGWMAHMISAATSRVPLPHGQPRLALCCCSLCVCRARLPPATASFCARCRPPMCPLCCVPRLSWRRAARCWRAKSPRCRWEGGCAAGHLPAALACQVAAVPWPAKSCSLLTLPCVFSLLPGRASWRTWMKPMLCLKTR